MTNNKRNELNDTMKVLKLQRDIQRLSKRLNLHLQFYTCGAAPREYVLSVCGEKILSAETVDEFIMYLHGFEAGFDYADLHPVKAIV